MNMKNDEQDNFYPVKFYSQQILRMNFAFSRYVKPLTEDFCDLIDGYLLTRV